MDDLGGQTVSVYRRRRVKAQDYADDGAPVPWPGCSVQPMSSDEQVARGLTVKRRWRLYAPAGFRARAQDQVEVVPGPEAEAGGPLRIGLDGPVSPWPDEDGTEHHVEAVLVAFDA